MENLDATLGSDKVAHHDSHKQFRMKCCVRQKKIPQANSILFQTDRSRFCNFY